MICILMILMLLALPQASQAARFDPFAEAGIDQRDGVRIPLDINVIDAEGRNISFAALGNGKPILLAPVLHQCPNICGITLGGLASAVTAQDYRPGEDFEIVAFGIDPREDSVDAQESLQALATRFPALAESGGIHAVTASPADIAMVTEALGYRYAWDERAGQYAHIAAVAVLTAGGRLARWLYGIAPQPEDLHLALTEAGEGRIGSLGDQLLLLCYHYDPETGRYGSLVWMMLRAGGAATLLVLGGFVAVALRRENREARK